MADFDGLERAPSCELANEAPLNDMEGVFSNLNNSPRSETANPRTPQRIDLDNLSRSIELQSVVGAPTTIIPLAIALQNQNLSSDEATEYSIISNTIGNAAGLITAVIVHYLMRGHYRTGVYHLKLKKTLPTPLEQEEMKKSDGFIYLQKGELNYLIKRSSKEIVHGIIDIDEIRNKKTKETKDQEEIEKEEKRKRENIQKLENLTRYLSSEDSEEKPPTDWEPILLDITHSRRDTFSGKTSSNPLYRAIKAWAAVGSRFGVVCTACIGIDEPIVKSLISVIMAAVFCVFFGLFGLAYFLVRDKVLKIPPCTEHIHDRTGVDSWSKYGRTASALGLAIGQGLGGLIVALTDVAGTTAVTAISFSIAFWGGLVAIISFIASLIFIPLINWVTSKFTRNHKGIFFSDNKNKFRNNYPRTGLYLGSGIGAIIGLIVSNYWLGILAAPILTALGGVIGGVILTVFGYRIHRYIHGPLPKGVTDKTEDVDNSWDYSTRCTASIFSYIGAAVACAINPALALLISPIGSAIGGAVGWGLGILIIKIARRLPGNKVEGKAKTLPWTQRFQLGANIGSAAFSLLVGWPIGAAGFILPGPASVVLAISVFSIIGALTGGFIACLADKTSRGLIWQAINPWYKPIPKLQNQTTPDKIKTPPCSPRNRRRPADTTQQVMIASGEEKESLIKNQFSLSKLAEEVDQVEPLQDYSTEQNGLEMMPAFSHPVSFSPVFTV